MIFPRKTQTHRNAHRRIPASSKPLKIFIVQVKTTSPYITCQKKHLSDGEFILLIRSYVTR